MLQDKNKTEWGPNPGTILITGSTNGIGKAAAEIFAGHGYRVGIHGRNPVRIQNAIAEINARIPYARLEGFQADISTFEGIHKLADEVKVRMPEINLFISNAGILQMHKTMSPQGYESTFMVNYLASFLLTALLIPTLRRNAPARILMVSSIGHRYVWVDRTALTLNTPQMGWVRYCRSKLYIIYACKSFAEKLKGSGVTVNAVHPGIIIGTGVTGKIGVNLVGNSREEGAANYFTLATSPEFEGVSGKYFEETKVSTPSVEAQYNALQRMLWRRTLLWTEMSNQEIWDLLGK